MEFREVKGYESLYSISESGLIKSIDRVVQSRWGLTKLKGVLLKQQKTEKGYMSVRLHKNGKGKNFRVHRLVFLSFGDIGNNCFCKLQINHKDCNKENNNISNLEMCNQSYNIKHAFENNLYKSRKGELNNASKLNKMSVKIIREKYKTVKISQRALANEFSVSQTTIRNVLNNKTWRYIDDIKAKN